jgi:mannose-1-phosphate guanylyltransferase
VEPESLDDLWACSPAGGIGSRLWPLSTSAMPKFLLDLSGSGRTLLQGVFDRVAPLVESRFIVVTNERYVDDVRAQLPAIPGDQVLGEPIGRDSMAAIGLAAAWLEQRDPHLILASFPADHVIPDAGPVHAAVRRAVKAARRGEFCLLGIEPTFPTDNLGYVRIDGGHEGGPVVAFAEKPNRERAAELVANGYRWNAGMWVCRAGVLLDMLADYHPDLAAGLRACARRIASGAALDPEQWSRLESIAIDHALAIPATVDGRVTGFPVDVEWLDVGDFDALDTLLRNNRDEVVTLGPDVPMTSLAASGLVHGSSGRRIVLCGVQDIVVIETDSVILVSRRESAYQVKELHRLALEADPTLG